MDFLPRTIDGAIRGDDILALILLGKIHLILFVGIGRNNGIRAVTVGIGEEAVVAFPQIDPTVPIRGRKGMNRSVYRITHGSIHRCAFHGLARQRIEYLHTRHGLLSEEEEIRYMEQTVLGHRLGLFEYTLLCRGFHQIDPLGQIRKCTADRIHFHIGPALCPYAFRPKRCSFRIQVQILLPYISSLRAIHIQPVQTDEDGADIARCDPHALREACMQPEGIVALDERSQNARSPRAFQQVDTRSLRTLGQIAVAQVESRYILLFITIGIHSSVHHTDYIGEIRIRCYQLVHPTIGSCIIELSTPLLIVQSVGLHLEPLTSVREIRCCLAQFLFESMRNLSVSFRTATDSKGKDGYTALIE